jgi:hypothetical protein
MVKHVSLLVAQTALHRRVAEDRADRLAERLGAVDNEEDALLRVLTPSVVIPSATTQQRPCSSSPSIIITARRTSSSLRLINSRSAPRVRSTNVRETAERDVDRACCSTAAPTGSCVRR